MDKFATLHTDMQSDAIPTCICEKSLADKVEKNCLACGGMLSGGVAPTVGLIGSVAVNVWKPKALKAAIAAALKANDANILAAANAAGIQAGKKAVIGGLKALGVEELGINSLESFFTESYHINIANAARIIAEKHDQICAITITNDGTSKCTDIGKRIGTHCANGLARGPPARTVVPQKLKGIVAEATEAANIKATQVAATEKLAIETTQQKVIEVASYNLYSAIGYSILAILIIVLIMVIIYLILRYRRKKKMKKKLQYIKLLEE
ncbi:surface antigen [Plasmodium falciparum UGT5.1]|uniref:Surface antigen n=1 Tax=Plasmodium falciparum UGT5.1 TaxID=1237627 RepID=W7JSG7_PLAFA|nr:surface antigen [Plasmodium falciparum UGT5.1]